MQLNVEWSRVIPLKYSSTKDAFTVPLDKLPNEAGVYIFGRKYGKNFEALYVGKASKIRGRVKGQLNNLRLMHHVRDATAGRRVLLAGTFISRPGQQEERCLPLIERACLAAEDQDSRCDNHGTAPPGPASTCIKSNLTAHP